MFDFKVRADPETLELLLLHSFLNKVLAYLGLDLFLVDIFKGMGKSDMITGLKP